MQKDILSSLFQKHDWPNNQATMNKLLYPDNSMTKKRSKDSATLKLKYF